MVLKTDSYLPEVKKPLRRKTLVQSSRDYYSLAREVVIAMRGPVSQRELSHRLGYSFNQVSKWDSGLTQIKWLNFLEIAEALNVPISNRLKFFFGEVHNPIETEDILHHLIEIFRIDLKKNSFLDTIIKKVHKNKVDTDFALILKLLDSRPTMLIAFLKLFVNCSQVDGLKEDYEAFTVRLQLAMRDPRVIFVNAALKTTAYLNLQAHDEALLASHAACSIPELRSALSLMFESHIIHFDGKKYHACPFDFSFSNLREPGIRQFTKFATQLAAEKYPVDPSTIDRSQIKNVCTSSVRVSALSSDAAKKLDILITKFHAEVSDLLNDDTGAKEHVQIIVAQSFVSNIQPLKHSKNI